eukprot:3777661-Amphidinium_carterae.1
MHGTARRRTLNKKRLGIVFSALVVSMKVAWVQHVGSLNVSMKMLSKLNARVLRTCPLENAMFYGFGCATAFELAWTWLSERLRPEPSGSKSASQSKSSKWGRNTWLATCTMENCIALDVL